MTTHSTTATVNLTFPEDKDKQYHVYYGWYRFDTDFSFCKGAAVLNRENNNLTYTNRDPNSNPQDVWFLFSQKYLSQADKDFDANYYAATAENHFMTAENYQHLCVTLTSYDTGNYVVNLSKWKYIPSYGSLTKDSGWKPLGDVEKKFTDCDLHEMKLDNSLISVQKQDDNLIKIPHKSFITLNLVNDDCIF